ncbi:MAG: leucine-rich repeat protein [Lachnospiraceae bacterium]|nr:leucine-rich repeat protein [Lachnospiraceae bacterium]
MAEEKNIESKRKINVKLLVILASIIIVLGVVGVIALIVPKNAEAKELAEQLELGEKYLDELQYEQAIAAYIEAIEIDPKCKEAYMELIDIYMEIGEVDKAEDILADAERELGQNAVKDKKEELKKKKAEYNPSNPPEQEMTTENSENVTTPQGETAVGEEETIGEIAPEDLFKYKINEDGTATISGINVKGLKEINVPEKIDGYTVTGISDFTFYMYTSMRSITLPETITKLSNQAFYWCPNLSSIELPQGLTVIEASMFSGSGLVNIVIPDGVTNIENHAFSFSVKLESATIPGSVTYIEDNAFLQCSSLQIIRVEQGSYAETWAKEQGFSVEYYTP